METEPGRGRACRVAPPPPQKKVLNVGTIKVPVNKYEQLGCLLKQMTDQLIDFSCELRGDFWEIQVTTTV